MNKSYTENLKENRYWLNVLDTKYFYGEDNHSQYIDIVNNITSNDIQDFASKLLDQDNIKTIVMMPLIEE